MTIKKIPLVIILLIFVISLAFFTSCKKQPVQKSITIDDITEETQKYLGKTVTVQNDIEKILGPRIFILDEDDLLVASKAPIQGPIGRTTEVPLVVGDIVEVTGVVRNFVATEIEREFGFDLNPEWEVEFERKPVIVANQVRVITPAKTMPAEPAAPAPSPIEPTPPTPPQEPEAQLPTTQPPSSEPEPFPTPSPTEPSTPPAPTEPTPEGPEDLSPPEQTPTPMEPPPDAIPTPPTEPTQPPTPTEPGIPPPTEDQRMPPSGALEDSRNTMGQTQPETMGEQAAPTLGGAVLPPNTEETSQAAIEEPIREITILTNAQNKSALLGKKVNLEEVPVQGVLGENVFWIGSGIGQKVLIVRDRPTMDPLEPQPLKVGEKISLEGTVEQIPPASEMQNQWQISPPTTSEIANEPLYIRVENLKIKT